MPSSSSAYYLWVVFCLTHFAVESLLPLQRSSNRSEIGSFCSRKCGEQQPADDEDIPLYQCSCSPSCSVYRDCCFDSPHKNTIHKKRDFMCLSVVGRDRYRAVSGCPPDHQSADFCKDGLGHLPPVTSRVTNVTYTNVFCAQCNGDKDDLFTWNVELRCPSDASTTADTKYIYQSGRIWSFSEATGSKALCKYYVHYNDSSFLDALELRSCSAHIRKKSSCSKSWKDVSVEEMCRSYEDPVYFNNGVFRNTHCALCNYLNPEFADCMPSHLKRFLTESGEVNSRVKHYCKSRGSDACIQYLLDHSKGRPYTFRDLVNINEKGCVPPKGKRCCNGEAYDFRSRRCRKLHT